MKGLPRSVPAEFRLAFIEKRVYCLAVVCRLVADGLHTGAHVQQVFQLHALGSFQQAFAHAHTARGLGRDLVSDFPGARQQRETVSFADGFPLLLVSRASLDDLNGRLSSPVPMNRFRPNLVVQGCAAFAEDDWRRIRIGGTEFELAKPCSRCVMPSIDQRTAQKDSEILRVLAGYRRGEDRQTYFGQNLLYSGVGKLRVGDSVEVLETKD